MLAAISLVSAPAVSYGLPAAGRSHISLRDRDGVEQAVFEQGAFESSPADRDLLAT
jgi:hypothetical protein